MEFCHIAAEISVAVAHGLTIYLDYNASAPLKPAVRAALVAALDSVGNPASVHQAGRRARAMLETAREQVAALARVAPAQVIFTSGGTEANNLALHGWQGAILTSAIEHDSVLAAAPAAIRIPVDSAGIIDLAALERHLEAATKPILLSVMLVNNETGVIQPIAEVVALARRYKAVLHCDAVQAAGKMALDFAALGVGVLSLSAHKIGGPQGVGALIVAENVPLVPLLRGGGQEKRRRAGTENLIGISGFGQAAALAAEDMVQQAQFSVWRDALEAKIMAAAPDAVIAGQGATRVGNTSCILMPKVKSATQLMAFDLAGIAVSSGAACSSGKVNSSHVLGAMGYDATAADSAVRVSLGWNTQEADLTTFADQWIKLYQHTQNGRN